MLGVVGVVGGPTASKARKNKKCGGPLTLSSSGSGLPVLIQILTNTDLSL